MGIYISIFKRSLVFQNLTEMMEVVLIPKLSYPRHPSPNVRYYFLLGLAEKDLKNKANYYHQLAGKNDSLNKLDGCVGSPGSLRDIGF
jgi:hypothetical protein